MLFAEEDAPHLKKWIVKRLEDTYVKLLPKSSICQCALLLTHCHLGLMPMPMFSRIMSWRS